MMRSVVKAVPLDNYIIKLQFDDGFSGLFDCKPYLEKGVFKKLKDEVEFNRVKISFGTIEWPCGIDFDPEGLYEVCKENSIGKRKQ
jgi:hypothetical protein